MVAIAHRGEQVAGQGFRDARRERCVFQVGTIDHVRDRHQPHQVDRAVAGIDISHTEAEFLGQVLRHQLGTVVRHFEPHGIAPLALAQLVFQRFQQIVGLGGVDQQVGIARHPELVAAAGSHAGEQLVDIGVDHAGQEHEIVRAAARHVLRQLDQPRQCAGRLHDGIADVAAEGILAGQRDDEVQRLVEDARKRVRRVQPDRRQHRQQLVLEVGAQPGVLLRRPVAAAHEADLLGIERRDHHLVERAVLLGNEAVGALADRGQQIGRRHAVRAGLRGAELGHLLEAGHADLEELVEIGAGDADELEPLQQRDRLVLGLVEYAAVEFEQRQLAVEIERSRRGHWAWRVVRHRFRAHK